jgi:hypothetical protein
MGIIGIYVYVIYNRYHDFSTDIKKKKNPTFFKLG